MNDITSLHEVAMDHAANAVMARHSGAFDKARGYFRQAWEAEREAAGGVAADLAAEPTRAVLHRSAAALAVECGELRSAEQLISAALAGNPPADIADELRDLMEQVNFQRHLDLRGIVLEPIELQLSIAGNAVGFGMAQSEVFVERVQNTERLITRTAERRKSKSFRERGGPSKDVKLDSELFVSVPRAASFAVSFRVGHSKSCLPFDEPSETIGLIDEMLDCLELFNAGDLDPLKARMPDEAYYNNFVGLAQQIAPDGNAVSLVGFTAVRDGKERRVALDNTERHVSHLPAQALSEPSEEQHVTVSGILRLADSHANANQIGLVDGEQKLHKILVPEGMMADIVRPLWNDLVSVEGIRQGKTIHLQNIRQIKE